MKAGHWSSSFVFKGGGKTFEVISKENVHATGHHVHVTWVNQKSKSYHKRMMVV
jgi:hypothetical protein